MNRDDPNVHSSRLAAFGHLEVGQTVTHSRRRTVTQTDNSWFTLLTLNTAPHFDVTAVSTQFKEFGGVLMNSCLTVGVLQGIALPDFGEKCLPNRGLTHTRLIAPVFAGDTLHAQSTVLECSLTEDEDIVRVRTVGLNQHDVAVCELERTYVMAAEGAWAREARMRTANAPKLPPNRRLVAQVDGPYLDDFHAGDIYDHKIGRTVFAEESIWFSLLQLNTNPHYIDSHFATKLDPRGVLIDDSFVLATVTGIGVRHTSQSANANLGWKDLKFHVPVFSGDTLFAQTEVMSVRPSQSRPGQGIVSVRTTGTNQRGEVVLTFDRAFLTSVRPSQDPDAL